MILGGAFQDASDFDGPGLGKIIKRRVFHRNSSPLVPWPFPLALPDIASVIPRVFPRTFGIMLKNLLTETPSIQRSCSRLKRRIVRVQTSCQLFTRPQYPPAPTAQVRTNRHPELGIC